MGEGDFVLKEGADLNSYIPREDGDDVEEN
jgi:hypothetical protein